MAPVTGIHLAALSCTLAICCCTSIDATRKVWGGAPGAWPCPSQRPEACPTQAAGFMLGGGEGGRCPQAGVAFADGLRDLLSSTLAMASSWPSAGPASIPLQGQHKDAQSCGKGSQIALQTLLALRSHISAISS